MQCLVYFIDFSFCADCVPVLFDCVYHVGEDGAGFIFLTTESGVTFPDKSSAG